MTSIIATSRRIRIAFVWVIGTAGIAAAVWPAGSGYSQEPERPSTREVRKFSLFFEADEAVEIELTTDHPEEIRSSRFLSIELFDGASRVAGGQWNLASLPVIEIAARPTGYGKAEIIINDRAGSAVSMHNNRIRLSGQIAISSFERDPVSGQLVAVPDPTGLRGLTTIVDRDGGRRTLMLVMTTSVEPMSR
jgi:hypothetical protein